MVEGEKSEVIVFKGSQGLGLAVSGGSDSFVNGIYIQTIVPESPAAKHGRLQPGDKLLEVGVVVMTFDLLSSTMGQVSHLN